MSRPTLGCRVAVAALILCTAAPALSGSSRVAWWFCPRTGEAHSIGALPAAGSRELDPPGEPARGNDWVLVIDDASRSFGTPGRAR